MLVHPEIKKCLSDEQVECIEEDARNRSILAPAGSGKTRTLTYLVANTIAQGVAPENIVAFTFTEKAAGELLARIHHVCGELLPDVPLDGLFVGTIHSWCFDFLRQQESYYNFTPLDELHMDALVSRLYDHLKIADVYKTKFPRGIDKFLADLEIYYNEHVAADTIPKHVKPSVEHYLDILQQNRLITFGGMIRGAVEMLEKDGPLETIKSLFVDEYQDVNPAQVRLIYAMLPQDSTLSVVGDDLQCIYQWRGSDVSRILEFDDEFPNTSTSRLSANYRSRPELVRFANNVGDRVLVRDADKTMEPKRSTDGCSNPVVWLSGDGEEQQAKLVVQSLLKFREQGASWDSMAVLLRSVVSSGPAIVDAMTANDIPVNCPVLNRAGQFINTLMVPLFEWIAKEHKEPNNEQEEEDRERKAEDLWQAAQAWVADGVTEVDFWQAVDVWVTEIEKATDKAYDVRSRLYDLFATCRIAAEPEDADLQIGLGICSQIIRSVEEIHRRRLTGMDRKSARGVTTEVLFALRNYQHTFGESGEIQTVADRVSVMTVHQAKGLEWPIVILPMLNRNRFPVRRAGHGTSFPDSIAARYGTVLDDERRLFYVAVTRAMERLILVDSMSGAPKKRSVFLNEFLDCKDLAISSFVDVPEQFFAVNAEVPDVAENPPIRLGLSDLLLFLECPYQFGLRRISGVQPSIGAELGYGLGLHEVIQRRLESETSWSEKEIAAQVDRHVRLPYMSEKAESQAKNSITKNLTALQEIGALDAEIETEVDISFNLPGALIAGTVDGIQKLDENTFQVRDWKSNVHTELLDRYERQLQLYSYALEKRGYDIAGADLVDISASAKSGKIKSYTVDISDKSVSKLIAEIGTAIEQIHERSFIPTPSEKTCDSCDVSRVCARNHNL